MVLLSDWALSRVTIIIFFRDDVIVDTKMNIHLLIYITIMYRCTKLVIIYSCTFDILNSLDKGSKNLKTTQKMLSL